MLSVKRKYFSKALSSLLCLSFIFQFPYGLTPAWAKNDELENPLDEAREHLAQFYGDYHGFNFEDILDGKPVRPFPLDVFQLLQQQVYPKYKTEKDGTQKKVIRVILPQDVRVILRDFDTDEEVQTLDMRDNLNFEGAGNRGTAYCNRENCSLSLRAAGDDQDAHKFFRPVTAVTTFGPLVLFITKDSYDAENKIQSVYMIDLEGVNPSVGNEDLPVFEIPVKLDHPATRFQTDKGVAYLDDQPLYPSILQQISMVYQATFNLLGTALDPQSAKAVLPFIDQFDTYTKKTFGNLIESSELDQQTSAENIDFERLFANQQSVLKKYQKESANSSKAKDIQSRLHEAARSGPEPAAEPQLDVMKKFDAYVQTTDALKDSIARNQELQARNRILTGASRRLIAYIASPKPYAAQKIKEGLASLIAGAKKSTNSLDLSKLTTRRLVTVGMAAAMVYAVSQPDSFFLYLHGAVDLTKDLAIGLREAISQSVIGDLTNVSIAAANQIFAPIIDLFEGKGLEAVYNQYIANEAYMKTPIAVTSALLTGAAIVMSIHMTNNLYKWAKDRKKPGYTNFIDRQAQVERRYVSDLSKAEAELRQKQSQNSVAQASTADTEATVDAWIEKKIREKAPGMRGKKLSDFDLVPIADPSAAPTVAAAVVEGLSEQKKDWEELEQVAATSELGKSIQEIKGKEKQSLINAIGRFMFGMPTFSNTVVTVVQIWNFWAGIRYCMSSWGFIKVCGVKTIPYPDLTPITLSTRILYPNFFSRLVLREKGETALPSELNGGMTPVTTLVGRWGKYWARKITGKDRFAENLALSEERRDFEKKIMTIESKVVDLATRKALSALPQYVNDQKELDALMQSQGAQTITDSLIRGLDAKSRTFVRTYYEQIYGESMQRILEQIVAGVSPEAWDNVLKGMAEKDSKKAAKIGQQITSVTGQSVYGADTTQGRVEVSAADLKDAILAFNQIQNLENKARDVNKDKAQDASLKPADRIDIKCDPADIEQTVNLVAGNPQIFSQSSEIAGSFYERLQNLSTNLKHNVIANLDPIQNPSMRRFAIVNEKLKDPLAVGRAARAEISNLFVTLPIDFTMMLLFTAGITEGVLKPIQEHLFGPNSIMYGSHYLFYYGFLSGWIMNFLGGAWVKIQEDAFHADAGNFGQIPKGEEANKSFSGWYLKQLFSEKNSLWKSYKRQASISFWNFQAAFWNIQLFKLLFLGRMEIDSWIYIYVVGFLTPHAATQMKIDQAFELSAYYDARDLPDERLLSHPRVQKAMQALSQARRNRFNMLRDILYTNSIGSYFGNLSLITAPGYGPRSFIRTFFEPVLNNYTPDETIIRGARKLAEYSDGIPILAPVTRGARSICEGLLANGRPDLILDEVAKSKIIGK